MVWRKRGEYGVEVSRNGSKTHKLFSANILRKLTLKQLNALDEVVASQVVLNAVRKQIQRSRWDQIGSTKKRDFRRVLSKEG